jgi:hypothetical protein
MNSQDVYLLARKKLGNGAYGCVPFQENNEWFVGIQYSMHDEIYKIVGDSLEFVKAIEDEITD